MVAGRNGNSDPGQYCVDCKCLGHKQHNCTTQKVIASSVLPARRPVSPTFLQSKKVVLNSILPLKRSASDAALPPPPPLPYVRATSAPGIDTIVHGLVAVVNRANGKHRHCPVRILIDTRATESCISEKCVSEIGAEIRPKVQAFAMANGSQALSKGSISLAICIQSYQEEVVLKVFPMNDQFDIILGTDWCRDAHCDILFSKNITFIESPSTGRLHEIVIQPMQGDVLCPIINAASLDKHIESDDVAFTCNNTALDPDSTASDRDKSQRLVA